MPKLMLEFKDRQMFMGTVDRLGGVEALRRRVAKITSEEMTYETDGQIVRFNYLEQVDITFLVHRGRGEGLNEVYVYSATPIQGTLTSFDFGHMDERLAFLRDRLKRLFDVSMDDKIQVTFLQIQKGHYVKG